MTTHMSHSPKEVTSMLIQWSKGDREALDRLIPIVYDELHRIAERYFRRERSDQTLQPTALVNELYVRIVNQSEIDWVWENVTRRSRCSTKPTTNTQTPS